jgi:hypothetical protein
MKRGSGSGLLLPGSRFWTRIRATFARILIPDPDPYIFVSADPGPSAAPDTLDLRFFDQFSEIREFIYDFFIIKVLSFFDADPVWKTFGSGIQDWPGSSVIGTELQAVFKIRIRSDFENLKERIRNPDPEEH